jgi:tetratricopeptide (TPR) repeat protein
MRTPSAGGLAQWSGLLFETRVGVELCVEMLLGEEAGHLPAPVIRVQPQAPSTVDDLRLELADGSRRELQIKSGPLALSWRPGKPFADALQQLYRRFQELADGDPPALSSRLELVVDHTVPASVQSFHDWLARARAQASWEDLTAVCASAREKGYLQGLEGLLPAADPGRRLAFLAQLEIRRMPPPDEWRTALRGRLVRSLVADARTAERVLDVLALEIQRAAPQRGALTRDLLIAALGAHEIELSKAPTAGQMHSFTILQKIDLAALVPLLPFHTVVLHRSVARPELAAALRSAGGVLVTGKPGSGKSHALLELAMAAPQLPVVVLGQGFRTDDVPALLASRLPARFQLVCDDLCSRLEAFGELVEKLVERKLPFRVLASCRSDEEVAVRRRLDRAFWRRAGVQSTVALRDLNLEQAAAMGEELFARLELELDEAARTRFARHVVEGDGGPLFTVASALLVRRQVGPKVRARDIAWLPLELVESWGDLYQRLEDRPRAQSLLHCLRFLYEIRASFHLPTVAALFTGALGLPAGDLAQAEEMLTRELWIARHEQALTCHIVCLEAVPRVPSYLDRFVEFAAAGDCQDRQVLGVLRHSLSLWYFQHTMGVPAAEALGRARHALFFATRAVEDARTWGQPAELGTMLINLSMLCFVNFGVEPERPAELLQRARDLGREGIAILRAEGILEPLHGGLENSLGILCELARLAPGKRERRRLFEEALGCADESLRLAERLGAPPSYALTKRAFLLQSLAALERSPAKRAARLREAADSLRQGVWRGGGAARFRIDILVDAAFAVWAVAGLEEQPDARDGAIQEAESYLSSALRSLRKEGQQQRMADLCLRAAHVYNSFPAREGDPARRQNLLGRAAGFAGRAADLAVEPGREPARAEALGTLSACLAELAPLRKTQGLRARDLGRARTAVEEAIRLAEGLPAVHLYRANAGMVYLRLAECESAVPRRADLLRRAEACLEQVLNEPSALRESHQRLALLNNVVTACSLLAALPITPAADTRAWLAKAAHHAEAALSLSRKDAVSLATAAIARNAALVYRRIAAGEPDAAAALHQLRRAAELAQQALAAAGASEPDQAGSHLNAALIDQDLMLRLPEGPEAETILARALAHGGCAVELYRRLAHPRELALALLEVGRLHVHVAARRRLLENVDAELWQAHGLLEESAALLADLGLEAEGADAALRLGIVSLMIGRNAALPDRRRELFRAAFGQARRGLRLCRQAGVAGGICGALQVAVQTGRALLDMDPQEADHVVALAQEGVAVARRLGDAEAERYFTDRLHEILPDAEGRLTPQPLIEVAAGEREEHLEDHRRALHHARATGDRLAEARALARIARLQVAAGQEDLALDAFLAALHLCREEEERAQEAALLVDLGDLRMDRGELDEASACYTGALDLAAALGDTRSEGLALLGLGALCERRGDKDGAAVRYEGAASRLGEPGDEVGKGQALLGLGDLRSQAGDPEQAVTFYEAALRLFQQGSDAFWTCRALLALGKAHRARGDRDRAYSALATLLRLAQPAPLQLLRAHALQETALLCHEVGRLPDARDCLGQALALYQEHGDTAGMLNALVLLGEVRAGLGDEEAALRDLESALSLCAAAGFEMPAWVIERTAGLHQERGLALARVESRDSAFRASAAGHLQRAVELAPALSGAWLGLLALALEKLKDGAETAGDETVAALRGALAAGPDSREKAFSRVFETLAQLEVEESPDRRNAALRIFLEVLRRMADLEPAAPALWVMLGAALYDAAVYEIAPDLAAEAERALRRALELEPENLRAWFLLGLVLLSMQEEGGGAADPAARDQRLDEAIAAFSSCINAEPEQPLAWQGLIEALCERALADRDPVLVTRALEAGRRLAELDGSRLPLARALALAGRTEEALEALSEALARSETTCEELTTDPVWQELREDPRFGALPAGNGT